FQSCFNVGYRCRPTNLQPYILQEVRRRRTTTMKSSSSAFFPSPAALLVLLLCASSARSALAFSAVGVGRAVCRGGAAPAAVGPARRPHRRGGSADLALSSSSSPSSAPPSSPSEVELEASRSRETPALTPEDRALVTALHASASGDDDDDGTSLEAAVSAALGEMHPRLVVALQLAAERGEWKEEVGEEDEGFEPRMVAAGTALKSVLDARLAAGRELLAELLDSGEVRKLDATIGKAAREGRLDAGFFSVLDVNLRDAMASDGGGATSLAPTLAAGEGQPELEGEEGMPVGANRLQILRHVQTRCQEELEKNVSPGMGLLNKLLRTDVPSIRANQLRHYLGPQATSITSPDGKVIELGGTGKPLVSHGELVAALSDAVDRIRTLESAGGTDRLSAANLVEGMRRVAMEARGTLVECHGEESEAVKEFQGELQPVFRPGSKVAEG
ncbi:hypothetical protein ACHAWF_001142, partial [Thalassiosira exigua]